MQLMGKLRKCGLEGMGRFLLNLLHEPNPCMLPSGQGTLVAPQAHGGGLVSKIFTPNNFYALGDCGPKFLSESFFSFKNGWLSSANFSC